MIKDKLKELLGLCVDNGLHFDYAAHVDSLTIYRYCDGSGIEYIVNLYNIKDWNGTEEQHIAKLNEFIEQIKGMN